MRKAFTALFLIVLIPLLTTAHHLRGAADDEKPTTQPYDWTPLDKVIGVKGEFKNDVCTFVLPRTDLTVAVDSMEVPIAAGIASEFHFFRCSCGKMRVVGQFCCVDYETNDVIDAIRVGGKAMPRRWQSCSRAPSAGSAMRGTRRCRGGNKFLESIIGVSPMVSLISGDPHDDPHCEIK